jgi:hypothetical protein
MEAMALGRRMHTAGVVLHGSLPGERWMLLLQTIAKAIGMSPVGQPAVWTYPVDGKGGQGSTIVLPITESFLALDTWPDFEGAYLLLCSCRPYHTADVDAIVKSWGLRVELKDDQRFYRELNLKWPRA